ncbi:hypothetical protein [Sinomonas sp.]|uniref:hypothetical protein n=1 Tax=Sinomonas sp. TaxID=1914986 RepID=UPI003F7FE0B5
MATEKFAAEATKEGKWWAIEIEGIEQVARAHKLSDIEVIAQSLVASIRNLSPEEVDVTVAVHPPAEAKSRWEAAKADLEAAKELSERGAAGARAVVSELRREYTLKEVARMLGITFQRVQQLAGRKTHDPNA